MGGVSNGMDMSGVAIVNASSRFSGIAQATLPYADALASLGHTVRWYQCVDHGSDPTAFVNQVVVPGFGLPFRSLEMGMNRLWTFPRRTGHVPEDLLLCTDPTLSLVDPPHRPRVVLVHDIIPLSRSADRRDSRLMFQVILPALRKASRVIVPTNSVRDELLQLRFHPDRVRVVPYTHGLGQHPEHVARSLARLRRSHELRLLYVATDRSFKNIPFFVELAKRLENPAGGIAYQFTLLSRLRPETRELLDRVAPANLENIEQVPAMGRLYDSHDVLVYPSLHEGLGRPIIEAMAHGMPVVANRIQPFVEILGQDGLLEQTGDLAEWERAVRSLAEPATLEDRANRALRASTRFTPASFVQNVNAAFQGLWSS